MILDGFCEDKTMALKMLGVTVIINDLPNLTNKTGFIVCYAKETEIYFHSYCETMEDAKWKAKSLPAGFILKI